MPSSYLTAKQEAASVLNFSTETFAWWIERAALPAESFATCSMRLQHGTIQPFARLGSITEESNVNPMASPGDEAACSNR
jgi:hypothetical protein